MAICMPCAAGIHGECIDLDNNDNWRSEYSRTNSFTSIPCCCVSTSKQETQTRDRSLKPDTEVTDPESTGRKRAAVLYPITKDMPCAWRGLLSAGGGKKPIVGCIAGIAVNRHHGPDKSTLNNGEGNVHLICADCHNRWHAANDPIYSGSKSIEDALPHDPKTKATPEQQLKAEMYWRTRPAYRAKEE